MSTGIPELERISELIGRWIDGSILPEVTGRLISVAARIVRRRLGGELYGAARSMGTDPETLAMALITPLFGEQPGPNSEIGRSWRRNPPATDPASAIAWLESVVFVTAIRELSRRNPDQYRARMRVRRRVRNAIRANQRLVGVPVDRPEYVRLADCRELDDRNQQVSAEEVRLVVDQCWDENGSDRGNIEAVVTVLSDLPGRCHLIPFSLLFRAVLEREQGLDRDDLERTAQRAVVDPDFRLKLERTIELSLAAADPILGRYVDRGKQTAEQSSRMRQGAGHFIRLRAEGQDPVQHECLREFWPGLTREDYRQNQKIREQFEYVIKEAWQRFEEIWKRDLGRD